MLLTLLFVSLSMRQLLSRILVEVVAAVQWLLVFLIHAYIFLSAISFVILMALFCIWAPLRPLICLILHLLLREHARLILHFLLLETSIVVIIVVLRQLLHSCEIVQNGLHVCEEILLLRHLIQDECKFNFIIIS